MAGVKDMIAQANRTIERLSPAQAQAELRNGALLVDLRETEERAASGTIAGALHVPRGLLEFHADAGHPYHKKEFEPGRRVILHCASGARSALAAKTLQEMGFTRVAHVEGGIKAWHEAGLPVETPIPR